MTFKIGRNRCLLTATDNTLCTGTVYTGPTAVRTPHPHGILTAMAPKPWITLGFRVSAPRDELEPPAPGRQRGRKKRLYGNVIESIGNNEWKVLYDNGLILTEKSSQLKLEPDTAGVQLVLQPSPNAPPPQSRKKLKLKLQTTV